MKKKAAVSDNYKLYMCNVAEYYKNHVAITQCYITAFAT